MKFLAPVAIIFAALMILVVFAPAGSIASSPSVQPLSVAVSSSPNPVGIGQNFTLTANATGGSGSYAYQWYSSTTSTSTSGGRFTHPVSITTDTAIAGATSSTYTSSEATSGSYSFYVVVLSGNGTQVTSSTVTETINPEYYGIAFPSALDFVTNPFGSLLQALLYFLAEILFYLAELFNLMLAVVGGVISGVIGSFVTASLSMGPFALPVFITLLALFLSAMVIIGMVVHDLPVVGAVA